MENLKILGFDIGVASIGWAFVEGGKLKDCGVRIFTKAENPKDGSSLALPRREARGVRRRLARRKSRLNALKHIICKEFGLNRSDYLASAGELPKAYATSKETKSPYQLRTESLNRKLSADEFARVILHIAKHRGYGNKHAKESSDDDSGKVKKAISENAKIMSEKGYTTAGQYLYDEFYQKARDFSEAEPKSPNNTQGTQEFKNVRNKSKNYARCLAQSELQKELEIIFERQKQFGFEFSDKKHKIIDANGKLQELDFASAVLEIAFLQRPLKSFADKVGKCTFYENEPRAPKDSLSAIEFVALGQIINTLRNLEKALNKEYGEVYDKQKVQEILQIVLTSGKISYTRMRKILALPKSIYFPKGKNLDYTKGNLSTQIKNLLYKISKKVNPKEKSCIYTKDQEMQIYDIARENGGISYAKLREILSLSANIKFDNTILGKGKGLDYSKENIEATIREMNEKDPESSAFLNFENLIKSRNAFEPKKFTKASNIENSEDLEENDEVESHSGVFANLAQNHRDELDKIAQDIANEKDKVQLRQKLESYEILKGKDKCLDSLSELNFSKRINLSFKALNKILPYMREGMLYNEAVELAQKEQQNPLPKPKNTPKFKLLPPLKDYEPYLANPVVARALSEYRKVCNALLEKYGKVHKIHIELGREVGKSYLTRQQYEKEQQENLRKINEAKERLKQYNLPENPQNILKARLFIEQGEYCAYSKVKITPNNLSNPKELEIDHIYPYSRSFDDSYMNKVLVFGKENQNKRNQTPYEAFGKDKEKWENIKSFAKNFLPHQKYKRIINENFADRQNEFKDRNLNDTRYMARLALNYTKENLEFEKLSENEYTISGEKNSKVHCEAVSGTLTTNLRRIWGFEDKDRDNHLHHALDAIIIAHINASMIQQFSEYYKRKNELKIKHYKKRNELRWQLHNDAISQNEYDKQDEESIKDCKKQKEELKQKWLKEKFCLPYGDFRQVVQDKINQIFVSKPPRKRARGALHKEGFGYVDKNDNWKVKFYNPSSGKLVIKDYGGREGLEMALQSGKIHALIKRGEKKKDDLEFHKFALNENMPRLDIYRRGNKFYAVPIYTMDFAKGKLPNIAIGDIEMNESEFCFSLFKEDLIAIRKKGMSEAVKCYYKTFDIDSCRIFVEKHDNYYAAMSENESKLFTEKEEAKKDKNLKSDNQRKIIGGRVSIQNLEVFEKWQVSPLGKVSKAEFREREPIALKSTPKSQKDNK